MITRYEYETFELAHYTTPPLRYFKICQDIGTDFIGPVYDILSVLRDEMEEKYSVEELTLTPEDERDFWIHKLGTDAGVELVRTTRCSADTFHKIYCLPDDDMHKAILVSRRVVTELSAKIKKAEEDFKNNPSLGVL